MSRNQLLFLIVAGCVCALPGLGQDKPVRVMFVGDIMLDNGPGHIITTGGDPFAPTAQVLKDADLTIGNLECALTRAGHQRDKTYTFKAPKASLPLLKKYFSAVSLANNHAADWGAAGFADELTLLKENGIKYFGGGATRREALQPVILEARGKRVALLGYNDFPPRYFEATARRPGTAWLTQENATAGIREARRRYKADYVLLFLHWGTEITDEPEPYQRELARALIDAGADAIIGGHPHVTQTIEWHKGKPIVYSLGNYLFDYYPGDPAVWTAWMARVSLDGAGVGLEIFRIELDAAGVAHLKSAKPERIQPK